MSYYFLFADYVDVYMASEESGAENIVRKRQISFLRFFFCISQIFGDFKLCYSLKLHIILVDRIARYGTARIAECVIISL